MKNIWKDINHESIFKTVEDTIKSKLNSLLLERNSYINRVYEIEEHTSKERLIVKFYRPKRWTIDMIKEEHKFLNALQDKEIPVIPPLTYRNKTLFTYKTIPYAIFPKKSGRAQDEFDENSWEALGRHLARIHMIGELKKRSKRIIWRPETATRDHLESLLKTNYILHDFKKSLKDAVELFIQKADSLFNDQEFILLHGDCHKGNIIHRPNEGIYLIDFDDICLGPPVQDLWMLLPDTVENSNKELNWFIKGYETFRTFNRKSLDLISALRGMRVIHFASWLAVQSNEPTFSKHFPHAGTKKYWNELIKDIYSIVYEELSQK